MRGETVSVSGCLHLLHNGRWVWSQFDGPMDAEKSILLVYKEELRIQFMADHCEKKGATFAVHVSANVRQCPLKILIAFPIPSDRIPFHGHCIASLLLCRPVLERDTQLISKRVKHGTTSPLAV